MHEYKKGDLVISIAGHDKDTIYLVYDVLGEYVFLIDGKYKTIEKNKKKKKKHIKYLGDFSKELPEKMRNEICKRIIKQYKKKSI